MNIAIMLLRKSQKTGSDTQVYKPCMVRICEVKPMEKLFICDCLSENPPSSHLLVFREIPF